MKMRLLLCIAVMSLTTVLGLGTKNSKVAKAFKASGLVPDVIPVAPNNVINVIYPSATVCFGEVIPQTKTVFRPRHTYELKPGVNYTLILFDPDVPSARAPALRSYLNGLTVDVTNSSENLSGTVIADYIPPTPYPGSGYHRFTILLYEQSRPLDIAAINRLRWGVRRYRFDVESFATTYGLVGPVAGNFFRSITPAFFEEYYCQSSAIPLAF